MMDNDNLNDGAAGGDDKDGNGLLGMILISL